MKVKRTIDLRIKLAMFFIIILLVSYGETYSQQHSNLKKKKNNSALKFTNKPDTLLSEIIKCSRNIPGYKIKVFTNKRELKKNKNDFSTLDSYEILGISLAPYNLKIHFIKQLLKYKSDSALVCFPPFTYKSHNDTVFSKNYTIQIDALYLINVVCFDYLTINYSPCPILYDTATNEEINYNQIKLKEVFDIYENWFELNKKTGFTDYSFPLLNSKYRWKYGIQKKIILSQLPNSPGKNWADISNRKIPIFN